MNVRALDSPIVEATGVEQMADTFKAASLGLDMPPGSDVWGTVAWLAHAALAVMNPLPGRIHKYDFTLVDKNGSTVTRGSMDELQGVAAQHRLDVSHIYSHINLAAPGELPWHADTEVLVWGHPGRQTQGITLDFKGSNKVQLDGVHAQLSRDVDYLQSLMVDPGDSEDGSLPAVPLTFERPAETPMVKPAESPMVPNGTHEPLSKWIQRTWREHTATFAVTVAGTVMGGAFLLWLGLTR